MNEHKPPTGLIFDMDGTLADNMPCHIASWIALFQDNGLTVTVEDYMASGVGGSAEDVVRHFMGSHISEAEAVNLAAQKEFLYRTSIRRSLKPIRGLRRFLGAMKRRGKPMAVATSAGRRNTEFFLDCLGLAGAFAAVACADDVARAKPEPDLFLEAARRIGIVPSNCLVFEDSFPGLESARRAGMRVVAITTAHSRDSLSQRGSVVAVIDDYTDPALLRLIGPKTTSSHTS